MVLLSLIPQFHLWLLRGRDWNGVYVSSHGDEPLYSAYVNALMEGRNRKNDPFGGRDSSSIAPLPESFFSIQFVPPYLIAWAARTVGASASTAFIGLSAIAAFFAGLSVFWLLIYLTGDSRLAAAGTLFVLCFGALAGGNGLIGILFKPDLSIPDLPFLRRYQPALAFPLFFVFQLLVWNALTTLNSRRAQISAILTGFTLVVLIFSYLYLWTAAVGWLTCFGLLVIYFLPSLRQRTLVVLITIGTITLMALLPYFYLVSQHAVTLDQEQILIPSRSPDLLRVDEILGAMILVVLVIGVVRRRIDRSNVRLIFAASLALLPFVVFNQQVVTGKTMQAYHFEAFAVNYSILVALVITLKLWWEALSDRLLVYLAVLSLVWGVVEIGLPSKLVYVPSAVVNDQSIPALLRLKELSKLDGTLTDLRAKGQASTLVFSPDVSLVKLLPTWASQPTLLNRSGVYCGNITRGEQKERYYSHLYYSKLEPQTVRKALNERDQFAIAMMFGHHRLFPALSSQFQPLQNEEIEREIQAYQNYANSFSRAEAVKRPITYAVIPADGNFDLTNLDLWYERDGGEKVGSYVLFRLKLRH